ncbi:tail protein [Cedecea neteri]|uniref:Tail protein n=1 Tax=Cedecea neteri TaxID=158822 RepID=A0A089RA20_9ENTR|nr:phage tail protein I [Cedecea neteri]AIR03400.1 tail protein [Cedecea neteri]
MPYNSLLPPNALPAERALEAANNSLVLAVPLTIRDVKNPDTCPLHLLPWLAWEYAVDFWDPAWTEAQKRQVVKDAAYVHQHRGTAGAVRRALGAVGYPTKVVEWFEDAPRAEPYTFRVEVYSTEGINAALYEQIRRQVNKAKNLRSFLASIDIIGEVGSDGEFYVGGASTAFIEVDIPAGAI